MFSEFRLRAERVRAIVWVIKKTRHCIHCSRKTRAIGRELSIEQMLFRLPERDEAASLCGSSIITVKVNQSDVIVKRFGNILFVGSRR